MLQTVIKQNILHTTNAITHQLGGALSTNIYKILTTSKMQLTQ